MKRSTLFYVLTVVFFTGLAWFVVIQGGKLETTQTILAKATHTKQANIWDFLADFKHQLHHPLAILLLQLMVILLTVRIFSYISRKVGQPSVIGEIIAGIVLGPSLVGMFFPEFSAFLFDKTSLPSLQLLSQIGLILFMFIIGMELDVKLIKNKAGDAVIISHASILFPYLLGIITAYFTYTAYAPASVPFLSFALFMGIAMSITAFPVLARIIQERGLTKTTIGTMAITCAAADDVTAWCILAGVIAIVKAGNIGGALFTILFSVSYVSLMIYVVRPILQKMGSIYVSKENVSKIIVAVVFLVLFSSAYLTELIGIHALFGAFLAGAIMPENLQFKKVITEKIEDISLVVLLPLFFVFTGLRTQIGLLNTGNLWIMCAAIVGVAMLGKVAGSALTARLLGQSWRNSLYLGALMNTRGLMELVVLNIGYELGILSPEIFAMLVIMALVTTFTTVPMLNVINYFFPETSDVKQLQPDYRILISFGVSKMGGVLLELAHALTAKQIDRTQYTAIHITPSADVHPQDALIYERESFAPIKAVAHDHSIQLETVYKATDEVVREITHTSRAQECNLLLIGSARSVFSDNILGGKVKTLIDDQACDVGVLVDKQFKAPKRVLTLMFSQDDGFLLSYANRLGTNINTSTTVLNITNQDVEAMIWNLALDRNNFYIEPNRVLDKNYLESFDLVLLSSSYWNLLFDTKSAWINHSPSMLIIKKGSAD